MTNDGWRQSSGSRRNYFIKISINLLCVNIANPIFKVTIQIKLNWIEEPLESSRRSEAKSVDLALALARLLLSHCLTLAGFLSLHCRIWNLAILWWSRTARWRFWTLGWRGPQGPASWWPHMWWRGTTEPRRSSWAWGIKRTVGHSSASSLLVNLECVCV